MQDNKALSAPVPTVSWKDLRVQQIAIHADTIQNINMIYHISGISRCSRTIR